MLFLNYFNSLGLVSRFFVATRLQRIDEYVFPSYLKEKVEKQLQKSLSSQEYEWTQKALKQFFKAWVLSGCKNVAMTSQGADALWHELILNTKEYHKFCHEVLGKFLHHTTNEAKTPHAHSKEIERKSVLKTWELCCLAEKRESYDLYQGHEIAALFALDRKLNLYDTGFIWFASTLDKEKFSLEQPHTYIKNLNIIEKLYKP